MRPTHFFRVLALVGVLAGALSLSAGDAPRADDRDAEISALKAKVQEQAQEICRLKAELEGARPHPFNLKLVPPSAVVPAPVLPTRPESRVPPNWTPREFNGMTFYLVPLTFDAQAHNGPRPPTGPFAVQGTLLPKPVTSDKK